MPIDVEGDERCTGREELPVNDFMTKNGRGLTGGGALVAKRR